MTTTTEVPAGPDIPTDQRRLTRATNDRIIAGVCAGLGDYFDIDPVIPRVVLAVIAVFGGAGLVIYAACWLLIPERGSPVTRLERWVSTYTTNRRRDSALVVLAIIVVFVIAQSHRVAFRLSGFALLLLVVMIAAALVSRRHRSATVSAGSRHDPAETATLSAAAAPAWQASPRVRRQRQSALVGWLSIGAALLAAGVLGLIGATGAAHPQPADVVAVVLFVLGAGLLFSAFVGRARALIPIGLLVMLVLAGVDALPRNLTWTGGNRTWAPTTAAAPFVLGAGDATLDLSRLGQATPAVSARVGAGRLLVITPPGRPVAVTARAGAGRVLIFGQENDGIGVVRRHSAAVTTPAGRLLTINLDIGFGDVEVRNAAA